MHCCAARSGRGSFCRAPRYGARVAEEISRFREEIEVHALPPIFHYWLDRYVRPKLEAFGFSHPGLRFFVVAG